MELKDRIRQRRKELGLSQEELAKRLGYKSRSSINKIELGKTDIAQSQIVAFANALNTTPGYIIGDEDNSSNKTKQKYSSKAKKIINPVSKDKTVPIPIVGEVAAGSGSYADVNNHIIDYFDVPESWVKGDENYVLLKVSGDSMLPEFMEDDLVLIRCQTSVDSGDYAVAIIDGENGVIKRVRYGKDWIELQSLNPIYAPRHFEKEEVLRVRIFGLVRKIIRNYN